MGITSSARRPTRMRSVECVPLAGRGSVRADETRARAGKPGRRLRTGTHRYIQHARTDRHRNGDGRTPPVVVGRLAPPGTLGDRPIGWTRAPASPILRSTSAAAPRTRDTPRTTTGYYRYRSDSPIVSVTATTAEGAPCAPTTGVSPFSTFLSHDGESDL